MRGDGRGHGLGALEAGPDGEVSVDVAFFDIHMAGRA